jgi:hypothetical protein
MFDISVLPQLIRHDIEHGETNLPPIPDQEPPVLAIDPSWRRQWQQAKQRLLDGTSPALDRLNARQQHYLARYLATIGFAEFEQIVLGCSYAATHYEMPASWRMCLLKQAYEDMQHSASYITRGCRIAGENYWTGMENHTYRKNVEATYPILRRDLGGFFAVVGLHTEAYPAETNILEALMMDPVLARWVPNEVTEEAGHLTFLYPAMRDYFHSGPSEEQERRQRQLVADNEILLETMLAGMRRNAERFLIDKLGLDPSVMEAFAHIPERTRFIYQTIGIEESYWPSWLKAA